MGYSTRQIDVDIARKYITNKAMHPTEWTDHYNFSDGLGRSAKYKPTKAEITDHEKPRVIFYFGYDVTDGFVTFEE